MTAEPSPSDKWRSYVWAYADECDVSEEVARVECLETEEGKRLHAEAEADDARDRITSLAASCYRRRGLTPPLIQVLKHLGADLLVGIVEGMHEDISAAAVMTPRGPVIALRPSYAFVADRQHAIAHELAHLILDFGPAPRVDLATSEARAERVADQILELLGLKVSASPSPRSCNLAP